MEVVLHLSVVSGNGYFVKNMVSSCVAAESIAVMPLFPLLLGAICESRYCGTEDRVGNLNIPRNGPCWALVQELGTGNTAESGGEGKNLQELLDSESLVASPPRLV